MTRFLADSDASRPLVFSQAVAEQLLESDLDIVLTGVAGWIGRATTEMLEGVLGDALVDRVHFYGSSSRAIPLRSGRQIDCQPLSKLPELDIGAHLLVHLAFKTREHAGSLDAAAYRSQNEEISDLVLRHARQSEVNGVFVPSSGAVYNNDRSLASDFSLNPYGTLKVLDEQQFAGVALNPVRTAIVRIFNLSGPFLNKPTLYALGSILRDIERGGPIRIRADRPVVRSYVHVRDVVDIAFAIMLGIATGPGEPFDTVGDRELEVGDLAVLAASLLGQVEIPIERPALVAEASADRYVGHGNELASLAAEYSFPLSTIEEQILDTASYLRTQTR